MKNLTPFTKILIGALIIGALIFAYNKWHKSGGAVELAKDSQSSNLKRDKNADLVIAYNTFPGMMGILYMNGGMKPNEDSKLFKEYGIKIEIKQMDAVDDTRDGLKAGKLDAVYCTTDALPIEMSKGSTLQDIRAKERLKINESRGADAIVVTRGIETVPDLKGKKIAYAVGTASNTLLINALETAGLSIKDVQVVKVKDGVDAAAAFKSGQVDAAVVWAPDDEDCVAAINGSKILISTSTATQIIADGLLITDDNYEAKKDKFIALAKAWMEGNALMNSDQDAKTEAIKLFAKGFNFPEDIAAKSADKIRFSTLGDNKQFFGFDPTFTGVTGDKMYTRMAVKYTELGLASDPAPWRSSSSDDLVQEIVGDSKLSSNPDEQASKPTTFSAPTKEDVTVKAQSSKVVTLNFPTASYTLTEEDKNIVDKEVAALGQAFEGARIRVEGNTDNVGNSASNKALSLQRAQSVVNYLVSEYSFDKNKFIVVGNGPDKPVADNSTEEGRQANRRTDFQFIW